jgi:glycosyltransferase involved in cell wall biosynthesis
VSIISVVIPAYRAAGTLADCVASVLDQDLAAAEVIVVSSSDDLPPLPADARLRVLRSEARLSAPAARNLGVASTSGELVAFIDADAVADSNWLARLVAASDGGKLAVAGGIANGTPDSVAGTVEYLAQFIDLHPRRPAATAWHGATCNLLVPRHLWQRFGPFDETLDLSGEDTALTVAIRSAGHFRFAGEAVVTHRNRTAAAEVIRHQYRMGRGQARLARRVRLKVHPLVRYRILAPVAVVARVVSINARVVAWAPELRTKAVVGFPLLLAALVAWGVGLVSGAGAL